MKTITLREKADEAAEKIKADLKLSNLNFQIQESPFSLNLKISKTFIKDYSPRLPVIQNPTPLHPPKELFNTPEAPHLQKLSLPSHPPLASPQSQSTVWGNDGNDSGLITDYPPFHDRDAELANLRLELARVSLESSNNLKILDDKLGKTMNLSL